MSRRGWTLPTTIAILAALAAGASAQTTLEGEIGADLVSYDFGNTLVEDGREMSVARSLSNQYLQLMLAGPVSSSHFASYSLQGRLSGSYYQVEGDESVDDDYTSPSLTRLSGLFTLFPDRSYPISFFGARAKDNSVRYEPSNRSDFDNQQPGLAVVRSYWSESQEQGGRFDLSLAEGTDFAAEYKHETVELQRRYDFGENRDIWVDITTFRIDPTVLYHPVDVTNEILDDRVILFVDFAEVDTLAPGQTLSLLLEKGDHDVDLVPLRLSPYRFSVDVQGDMLWRVLYTPPAGPKDRDEIRDTFSSRLEYGGSGRARGEARLEHSSADESVQGLLTDLTSFNNIFNYDLSGNTKLNSMTTWSRNDSKVRDISSQLSGQLLQQTSLGWEGRRQKRATLTHMYSRMTSDSGTGELVSATHQFDGVGSYSTGLLNHIVDLRLNTTMLDDNQGYASDQYSSEMRNRFSGWLSSVRWTTASTLKYVKSKQRNPDSESDEKESRLLFEAEQPRIWVLGTLSVRGEYNWRDRETEGLGNDVKNLYRGEVRLARRFGPNYQVSASLGKELETFGGSVPTPGGDVSGGLPKREDERRQNINFTLRAQPYTWANVSGNLVLVDQTGVKLTRMMVTSTLTIPRINLPLRFMYSNEKRQIEGLPEQTRSSLETVMSYNFRQVRLAVQYKRLAEKLAFEDFEYGEIIAQISRRFQIY